MWHEQCQTGIIHLRVVKTQDRVCVFSVSQSCPTLCDPIDHRPHRTSMGFPRQVAVFYSRASFRPRDWTHTSVSCKQVDSLPLSHLRSPTRPWEIMYAAAAKSLQSCLTLCDPIDGSPLGSTVPGILQARTLEWVAISFSSAWKWKVKVKSLCRVQLSATPRTAAHQAPPSMGFSRQEYWSGVPLPSPVNQLYSNTIFKTCWKTKLSSTTCWLQPQSPQQWPRKQLS